MELKAKLVCTKEIEIYLDIYKRESRLFEVDEIVKCKVTDFGIRIEYKDSHYTDLYKPSSISEYFKFQICE